MSVETHVPIKDLDSSLLEDAKRIIGKYTTALMHQGELVGTGTFAICCGLYGILTARHVARSTKPPFDFRAGSGDMLTLDIEEGRAHAFQLPMDILQIHDSGAPDAEDLGPDLAFLAIPECPQLGTIKAKKSFWNIDHNGSSSVRSITSHEGAWALAHYVAEEVTPEQPLGNFRTISRCPAYVSFGGADPAYERDGFDYIDSRVVYGTGEHLPVSFGGGSGGGIWTVPFLAADPSNLDTAHIGYPLLAGVMFYQTDVSGNQRSIRCHGPRSIYQRLPHLVSASD